MWGTVGDTIGGISNLFTMLIALGALFFARNEVRRARALHAAEVRADAARSVWRTAHAYARDTVAVLKMAVDEDRKAPAFAHFHGAFRASMLAFQDVSADGTLFFEQDIHEVLLKLALECGKAAELLNEKSPDKKLLAEQGQRVWLCALSLKDLIRPHAILT